MADSPVFVALDTTDLTHAVRLTTDFAPYVAGVKLGLEFFNRHGCDGVMRIAALGVPVFLDLKLHDIPNTVEKAVRSLAGLPVTLLTVHASGGAEMIRRAVLAAGEALGPQAQVIAVTLLTSLDAADVQAIGFAHAPEEQVVRLARLAKEAGAHGVVCSPHEIAAIRAACGDDFTLVVPGIRPEGSEAGDQKRSMTPKAARERGATYLVIGRPITDAADPLEAAKIIAQSL